MSWDFHENFTQNPSSSSDIIPQTQQRIRDDSSSDEEFKKIAPIPTQAIVCDESDESEDELEITLPGSPVFENRRKKENSPQSSPVFHSQSLLSISRNSAARRNIFQRKTDNSSEDLFGESSQQIESAPSTQQSPEIQGQRSNDSTKISSASSLSLIDEENKFHSFYVQAENRERKIKKPKKGGFVEKLDFALKKQASERVLNQHLPSKLRKSGAEKKIAQVLKLYSDYSLVVLTCQDYQLDPNTGKQVIFDLIVDNPMDLKTKKLSDHCDISIESPWLTFYDAQNNPVISNVFKFEVLNHQKKKPDMLIETKLLYEKSKD